MNEEQFKVLKAVSEATSRMDLNLFSKKVNLTPNETIQQMQQLTEEGFLHKVGGGYGITEKGKTAIKALTPVAEETSFQFYYGLDQPADITVDTLEDFYVIIKQIAAESLEFHLYRGDFEKWLMEAFKDPQLANDFGCIKASGVKGEELRAELLKALDESYGIQQLL